MPSINSNSSDKPSLLTSDVLSFGKKRVSHWFAWFLIGLLFGIPIGVVLVANQNGDFDLSFAESPSFVVQHEDLGRLTIDLLQAGDVYATSRGLLAPNDVPGDTVDAADFTDTTGVAPENDAMPSADTAEPAIPDATASANSASGDLGRLIALAQKRQNLMERLLEQDHAADVLTVALPKEVRDRFPVEVQPYIETAATRSGEFKIFHVDSDKGESTFLGQIVNQNGVQFNMLFATGPIQSLLADNLVPGAVIRVRGVQVKSALALQDSSSDTVQVLQGAPQAEAVTSAKPVKTVVVLVDYLDSKNTITPAQAREAIFGSGSSLKKFYEESSYGKVTFTGDVVGPYTLPEMVGTKVRSIACSNSGMKKNVININVIGPNILDLAKQDGVNLKAYQRQVFICAPANYGGVGGGTFMGGHVSWINGAKQIPQVISTAAHELGHDFNLVHANALWCDPPAMFCEPSRIGHEEYGDRFDTMGSEGSSNYPWHFNAVMKDFLKWFTVANPITTVTADGVYAIGPYETPGPAPKALKIKRGGLDAYFYVETRKPIGFDLLLPQQDASIPHGVLVHYVAGTKFKWTDSYLLDATPQAMNNFYPPPNPLNFPFKTDLALQVNQTFTDSITGTSFTPLSVDAQGATVKVVKGTENCLHLAPSLNNLTRNRSSKPGGTFKFTLGILNNDTPACADATSFAVTATGLPAGWSVIPVSTLIDQQKNKNATFAIKIAASTAPGIYSFTTIVTDPLGQHSAVSFSSSIFVRPPKTK